MKEVFTLDMACEAKLFGLFIRRVVQLFSSTAEVLVSAFPGTFGIIDRESCPQSEFQYQTLIRSNSVDRASDKILVMSIVALWS